MVALGITLLGGSLMNSGNDPWTSSAIAALVGILMAVAGRSLKSPGLAITAMVGQLLATICLFPTEWWNATSPNAITLLGFYIVPASLVAPFVGLTWLLTPAIARPVFRSQREASDLGLAAFITLCFAPLLHSNVHLTSLAAAILTAGLALMTLGSRRNSKGLTIYGVAVLAAGTVGAIANNWWDAAGWGHVLGLTYGPEVFVLLYAAGAWLLTTLATLRLNHSDKDILARFCAAITMALLMAAPYHAGMPLGVLCISWLAIATAAGASRKLRPQLGLDFFMLAGLVPATAIWIIEYAVDWHDISAPLLLHPGLGIAALLAGAFLLGSFWSGRMPNRPAETTKLLHALTGLLALALVFTSTSLEVARVAASLAAEDQVRAAAVSIWWGIFAVILITAGFWRRITPARHVGLGLLAVAMIKAMILDLQGVPQIWRIASFIGLGLLMLGVAVAYSKVSALWNDKLADEPSPDALPSP
jgi:uncharacterized membrane protein